MTIELAIKKNEYNEYEVVWRENGKKDEGKTYYTSDPEDAVNTLVSMLDQYRNKGTDINITENGYTRRLIAKYAPNTLLAETIGFTHKKPMSD